ncbi:MAG TPA: polysaccharide biosynthesis/export family protein, partial [Planctomycetota bacterium]|nr:polysaccharide biosynthesis/export family protein [Planctomycetota bacterium]
MGENHMVLLPPGPSRRSRSPWLPAACLWLGGCSVPLTQDPSPRTPLGEEAVAVSSNVNPAAAPQAVPLRAPTEEYRIGPRDLLEISVLDQTDWTRQVPVRPDGRISYPLVGDVEVAGRSVEEVRADLERRLQRYLRRPRVSVSVREFVSQLPHVYLGGEVRAPGAYELRPPHDSFLDAVFAAGGVTADADLSLAYVIRGKDVIASDFDRILRQGTRGGSNFVMTDRDLVYFPRKDFRFIYVLGEVERPGAVAAPHPM